MSIANYNTYHGSVIRTLAVKTVEEGQELLNWDYVKDGGLVPDHWRKPAGQEYKAVKMTLALLPDPTDTAAPQVCNIWINHDPVPLTIYANIYYDFDFEDVNIHSITAQVDCSFYLMFAIV